MIDNHEFYDHSTGPTGPPHRTITILPPGVQEARDWAYYGPVQPEPGDLGPPPEYDSCDWPYTAEDHPPQAACRCYACDWVRQAQLEDRAHDDDGRPYDDEEDPDPGPYDQCWWCEEFVEAPRPALVMADGGCPIIHAHCVDEYLSTQAGQTGVSRLTPAETAAITAWCALYDDGLLIDDAAHYSAEDLAALATTRSQLNPTKEST